MLLLLLLLQELLTSTMNQLEEFALEGLRTLMVGTRDMSDDEFATWDEVSPSYTTRLR